MKTSSPDAILLNLAHLRITGPDAERYLNGQVTQNLSNLTDGKTCYSFVCDVKGRIIFDAYITRQGDDFLLNAPLTIRDEVIARLDRYLIADDCELIDESDKWAVAHSFLSPTDQEETGTVNRFGQLGRDRYLPKEEALKLIPNEDEESLNNRRIAFGIPSLAEIKEIFPAESGREQDAVSFHKGCYLGQEVISRMKRAGRTNRSLISLTVSHSGAQLPLRFVQEEGGKPLLEITSISSHANLDDHYPALGLISRKADLTGNFTCPEAPELQVTGTLVTEEPSE